MKTTMGILAGKASHFVLSKLGRGSTLPGKIALKFDKDGKCSCQDNEKILDEWAEKLEERV